MLVAIGGCAQVEIGRPREVPYDLTTCPGPVALPQPLPRWRTVEMVAEHDAGLTTAQAITERRRAACAETLRRLVEWVGANG